jgi:hypothetical protein
MQHSIRTITASLLQRLRDEQLHYTPSELEKAGFPVFLVNRIRLELERNLAESVTLPDSDWADMQTDSVQDAWDNFLKAIRAETRIPHSFLQSVTENAVEDTLELLAEPERMVLETLFRSNEKALLVELMARRNWVTINGHLADALIRYLSKRNLSEITKEKAANLLRQIDVHIAAGYTPLKWGQALDTWFTLFGSSVPSNMVARFFADKGMDSLAKRFSQADENLSRSQLIEYLSMPDFGWTDEDDDEDANIATNATIADVAAASTPNDAVDASEQTLETESDLSDEEGPSKKPQTFEKVEILDIENYMTKEDSSDENSEETDTADEDEITSQTVSPDDDEILPETNVETSLHEQLNEKSEAIALVEVTSKDSEISSPGGGTDDDWIKILSDNTPVTSKKVEEQEIVNENVAEEEELVVENDDDLDAANASNEENDELGEDEDDDGTGIDDIFEIEDDPDLTVDEDEIEDEDRDALNASNEENEDIDEDELDEDEQDDDEQDDDQNDDENEFDEDEFDEDDDGTGIDDIFEIEDDPDLDDSQDEIEDEDLVSENESGDGEEVPIWQRFMSPEDGEEESVDEAPAKNHKNGSLLSNLSEDSVDDESKSFADSFTTPEDDEISPSDLEEIVQETEDEVANDDSEDVVSFSLKPDENEDENDDNVIYLTEDAKQLLEQLSSEKEAFIEELFRNDEVAFYTQLNEIVQFDTWQNAGRYVMREIYTKNRVDMYSDVAVAFTDTVQQYFEVKNA